MIVKNEASRIAECLSSARDLVDGMIVVDTGSSDGTREAARACGAQVFDFPWTDNFAAARNYAIEQSTADWNLVLDADEKIVSYDRDQLRNFLGSAERVGTIKIVSKFYQDRADQASHAFVSRILPRGARYEGIIHEQVKSPFPRMYSSIEVFHDGYYLTDKSDRNVKLLQLALQQDSNDPYLHFQLGKQYKVMKRYSDAQQHFAESYRTVGVRDAYRPDLVMDYLYNCMSLSEWELGLQLLANEEQRYADFPDFHFFQGLFFMELVFKETKKYAHLFPRIERQYVRCLELGETQSYNSTIGTGSFLAAYNLAVFYETTGKADQARRYYVLSADLGYEPARTRLAKL
jgi:glycosyltransferase involved in cell wall biosynthesis